MFIRYTRRIIEGLGGSGGQLDACAKEIYAEWAACQHFFLYDDVMPALWELAARDIKPILNTLKSEVLSSQTLTAADLV